MFSSHIRVHGIGEREPWAFGADTEAIARKWLGFRYRLIPYLQRAIAEAVATGMPVMRAMALAFPGNALTRGYETQFMCGDALLVAPVIQPGGEVEVALPPGAWYDLISRQRFPGQRVLRYKAGLDQFPVFGREGYALPMGFAVQHTGEIDAAKPLEQLWVFGRPTRPLHGFLQANIVEAIRRHVRDRGSGRREGRALRRRGRHRRRQAGVVSGNATIAITAGEPAGIGPELVALLAARHRERPFPARLVIIGDRELLTARARRIGVSPRYADYDAASFAPAGGGIEIWHQPMAAPVTPGHPDPSNAYSVLALLQHASDACADRRVCRTGDGSRAEERAAWTPASRSPGTPNSSRSAPTRPASS